MVSITSSLHLGPDDVARHTFGSVRRGFDPDEVRPISNRWPPGSDRSPSGGTARGAGRRRAPGRPPGPRRRRPRPLPSGPRRPGCCSAPTKWPPSGGQGGGRGAAARAEAHAEIEQHRSDDRSRLEERGADGRSGGERAPRADRSAGAAGIERARIEADDLLSSRQQCRAMVDEAQGCGRGSWPTWPSGARCSTPRSNSSVRDTSGWPRRSTRCAARSMRSPMTCSPPRTTPGWPPKLPVGRRSPVPTRAHPKRSPASSWPKRPWPRPGGGRGSRHMPIEADARHDRGRGRVAEVDAADVEELGRRGGDRRRHRRERRPSRARSAVDALFAKLRAASTTADDRARAAWAAPRSTPGRGGPATGRGLGPTAEGPRMPRRRRGWRSRVDEDGPPEERQPARRPARRAHRPS